MGRLCGNAPLDKLTGSLIFWGIFCQLVFAFLFLFLSGNASSSASLDRRVQSTGGKQG